ncbi:uncharacterized protein C8Q71DRAFT_737681 [Rhodofomes roseus]|uniref:F-box domain-containing protein n=1 Tax=Rhodofomes roseus TaxID=34475 RepID=A0ABQ8KRY1_9APHY|nr:uncharacterized protein C8Q71DRAFT_737681 [Rhodofomes roseus]KAH9841569.1 hypothetical protein C8Q71DRAFT_737681 [Rhodofomes roseus]
MDRLCDEIIQIILNCLDDPTHFSLVSRRFYAITKDPYVRSSYFLARHGRTYALYYALARGKLLTEKVVDIMISSGAHLSRYLAQCAIHHYFRAQVHFIKTRWVRSVPLPVFTHFMMVAAKMYGDIPTGKGEDDGTIFGALLKTSRLPTESRGKWETIKEVVEKYKFIPFCAKDPMMAQFPLVLAVEPRLLPYARANGFIMDHKFRNFMFRKMFEKPAVQFDGRVGEVVNNVHKLTSLDPNMFVTRTVAAEVCMEAHLNDPGYTALKILDKEGALKFSLAAVVEELLKTFINTRSIAMSNMQPVLRKLHSDFPSEDPTVRVVMLSSVFFIDTSPLPAGLTARSTFSASLDEYVQNCKEKVQDLGLAPVTRKDLFDMLVNKFTPDKFVGIIEYGHDVLRMSASEIKELKQDVALACLEVGCKGKMLKKLVEADPPMRDVIATHVVQNLRLNLDDLPWSDDEEACQQFEAKLCRDFVICRRYRYPAATDDRRRAGAAEPDHPQQPGGNAPAPGHADQMDVDAANNAGPAPAVEDHALESDDDEIADDELDPEGGPEELGQIGQDTLTAMIRKDEISPVRRRRFYDMFATYADHMGKLTYPSDYLQVGRWIHNEFGPRHPVTAIFMLHAVVNENAHILQNSLYSDSNITSGRIPVTLKHFKMLARLGRPPNLALIDDIEAGIEFYFDEDDYLSVEDSNSAASSNNNSRARSRRVKVETDGTPRPPSSLPASPESSGSRGKGSRGRKRPRRTTTLVKSYAIPDSDDENIAGEERDVIESDFARKRRCETNLQQWIKHLSVLLKEEQRKYKEKRKREQAAAEPGAKLRVPKSEFFKSLATNLNRLRKADREKRQQLYGTDVPSEDYSEGEEDEYQYRTTRSKRYKVEHV